ncbi:MAG: MATE family efflux transporter [Oscillospiraceae bacterium]
MRISENTILKGKIFPPLIKFTIPLMLAVLLQALYGAVDLIVVGKFGTTSSVSAVANGSQIMHTVTGIIAGLGMGVTVLIGRFVGAKNDEKSAQTIGGMIKLFSVVAVLITVIMVALAEQIAILMKVPPEAMEQTVAYLRICSAGTIFIVAYNAISGLFRGLGDSKSPLLFIAIACITNVIGDLLLVGVFKLDAAGAAYATVFAQGASVVFSLLKIKKSGLPFKVERRHLKKSGHMVRNILKTGGPLAAQDCLVSTSFLIILAIMNSIGLIASASIGIAEKLFVFLAIVPMSFMSGLSAFVAQNVGARQEDRALRATRIAMGVSLLFGIGMSLLTYFGGDMLASIFEKDPVVIASTHSYLMGVSGEYVLISMVFCFLGYFNGVGKTTFVMLEGLISSFLVRIPLSYFLSRLPDTNMFTIGLAVPVSACASLIMCIFYFFHVRKKRLAL